MYEHTTLNTNAPRKRAVGGKKMQMAARVTSRSLVTAGARVYPLDGVLITRHSCFISELC